MIGSHEIFPGSRAHPWYLQSILDYIPHCGAALDREAESVSGALQESSALARAGQSWYSLQHGEYDA